MMGSSEQEIIVVAGVSSSGKSTFINDILIPELIEHGKERADIRVCFGRPLSRRIGDEGPAFKLSEHPVIIIHYNLLMQLRDAPELDTINHSEEPLFARLISLPNIKGLYLCYAPDDVVRQRIATRAGMEPDLLPEHTGKYPSDRFLRTFEQVDQRRCLLDFGEQLAKNSEKCCVVFSRLGQPSMLTYDSFLHGIPDVALQEAIS